MLTKRSLHELGKEHVRGLVVCVCARLYISVHHDHLQVSYLLGVHDCFPVEMQRTDANMHISFWKQHKKRTDMFSREGKEV